MKIFNEKIYRVIGYNKYIKILNKNKPKNIQSYLKISRCPFLILITLKKDVGTLYQRKTEYGLGKSFPKYFKMKSTEPRKMVLNAVIR